MSGFLNFLQDRIIPLVQIDKIGILNLGGFVGGQDELECSTIIIAFPKIARIKMTARTRTMGIQKRRTNLPNLFLGSLSRNFGGCLGGFGVCAAVAGPLGEGAL